MTPEERAVKFAEHWDQGDSLMFLVDEVARMIRDTENDALEAAAKLCRGFSGFAEQIRALKTEAPQ